MAARYTSREFLEWNVLTTGPIVAEKHVSASLTFECFKEMMVALKGKVLRVLPGEPERR